VGADKPKILIVGGGSSVVSKIAVMALMNKIEATVCTAEEEKDILLQAGIHHDLSDLKVLNAPPEVWRSKKGKRSKKPWDSPYGVNNNRKGHRG